MKFQPGDRVVYAGDNSDIDYLTTETGKRATVHSRKDHDQGINVVFEGDDEISGWYYDRRFILESVYDSPLYKALK